MIEIETVKGHRSSFMPRILSQKKEQNPVIHRPHKCLAKEQALAIIGTYHQAGLPNFSFHCLGYQSGGDMTLRWSRISNFRRSHQKVPMAINISQYTRFIIVLRNNIETS